MELTASVIVLTVAFLANADAIFERKTMRMDRFLGVCPGYKNASIQIYDVHIKTTVNKDFSMGLKIRVLKDTSSDLKMKMVFDRCKSKEALDTCEPSPDVNFSQVCTVINARLPPFSSAVEKISPKIGCPIKKGNYVMPDVIADQTTLSMFPVLGWYLRGHTYLLENIDGEYKVIFCTYMEGTIAVVK